MENRKRNSFSEETKESTNLFRNTEVTELVRFCIQPRTRNDMKRALSRFYYIIDGPRKSDYFREIKVLSMYVLDYVYKQHDVHLSMVSRTVYAYCKQMYLESERNIVLISYGNWIETRLNDFTTFETTKGESVRVKAVTTSLVNGSLAFTTFLIKFGLEEFPSQANEISIKMIDKVLFWFNMRVTPITANIASRDLVTFIHRNDLLNYLKETKINFRRCIMTFIATCIAAEYRICEILESRRQIVDKESTTKSHNMRCFSTRKMKCLDLFIQATPETNIAFKDIEYFFISFLNHHLKEVVSKSLLETAKKIFTGTMEYYQPRTLKDLTRCKIRTCLRKSALIPQKVYALSLPTLLKEFLLFENSEFWKTLTEDKIWLFYKRVYNLTIVNELNA